MEAMAMAGVNQGHSRQTAYRDNLVTKRVVIALTGLLLLIGGVLFDSITNASLDYYEGWTGISGVGVVLIIAGLLFGALAAFLPRGKLPVISVHVLFGISIPIAVVVVTGLAWFSLVSVVCACD